MIFLGFAILAAIWLWTQSYSHPRHEEYYT